MRLRAGMAPTWTAPALTRTLAPCSSTDKVQSALHASREASSEGLASSTSLRSASAPPAARTAGTVTECVERFQRTPAAAWYRWKHSAESKSQGLPSPVGFRCEKGKT